MEKKLKVSEVYECVALLGGFANPDTKIATKGFINETSISEGMRRISNKTLKKLNENWPKEQIENIQKLTKGSLPELQEGEERDDDSTLLLLKQSKIKELLDNEATIIFEELPDFQLLDKRLEERGESLSFNYTYLYEKLFLNY